MLGLLTIGDGFIYLALLDHGDINVTWFPLFYVGTNVAYLLLAVPIGRLADRVGRARILVVGHLALVGAYLCAVLPTSTAAATVGTLLLLGTFYAATDGVIAAIAGAAWSPSRHAPAASPPPRPWWRSPGCSPRQGSACCGCCSARTAAMATVAALLALAVLVAATRITRLDGAAVTRERP